jgi:ATP/maltotriose-dependent transcriptional regulator MalT
MLGLSDNQISTRFVISTETVKTHVKHIYRKLGVNNRTKAVVKSIAAGLISLEEALSDNLAIS